MTAPTLPRPTVESLRADLAAADAAYTLAVQHAAQTRDWAHVRHAHEAVHQARAALETAEGQEQT